MLNTIINRKVMKTMTKQKSNIIIFMVDQLSAKWLESACNGVSKVPNINGLKEKGIEFTHAITSNPVCCPARATIATGMTSRGHGVLENGYYLDPELPTFMKDLQKNGWRTGAFGKLHLESHEMGPYNDYNKYGYDVVYNTEDQRAGAWLDWVEKQYPEYYEAALATVWPLDIKTHREYGKDKKNLNEMAAKARSNINLATEDFPKNKWGAYTTPFPEEVTQSAWITQHATQFIKQTQQDIPIYAHISYVAPHGPYCPPANYMKNVDVDKIPEPVPAEWYKDKNAPKYFMDRHPEKDDWLYKRHLYFADISFLDKQLGDVIDALEESGRLDNTYIFFLADHGDLLADHGFYRKEERHYDACIRVPFIVSGPNLKQGVKCEALVQLEDICPTIYDIADMKIEEPPVDKNLKIKNEEIKMFHGNSILELCRGKKPNNWREGAYVESYNSIFSMDLGDWARTIRTDHYRYTYYAKGNGEQLFDLLNDSDEINNVVKDPEYKVIRQQLREQLLECIIMQDYPKTRRSLYKFGAH